MFDFILRWFGFGGFGDIETNIEIEDQGKACWCS
jgi:hypothetical protein